MRKTIYAAAGAVLVIGIAAPGWAFAAGPTTVEVTSLATAPPTGPNQFVAINQSGATGDVSLVSGPATPPLGAGSLQMSVSGSTDHWSVYNYDHDGAALSAITALSYSTYTDNTTTAPALQLADQPGPACLVLHRVCQRRVVLDSELRAVPERGARAARGEHLAELERARRQRIWHPPGHGIRPGDQLE